MTLSLRRLRAWLRLLRLVRGLENQLREFLRVDYNTTLPRFDVAAALYRHDGPLKMSDLSKQLLVSNGNATSVVDRLEKEGKAKRVPLKEDKRVVLVELTTEGREWFSEIAKSHEKQVNKIFSGLTDQDLDQLRDLIRIVEITNRITESVNDEKNA
ncbi:MarR family winged helix-turn-helix transcriptional regulator [Curvivirga aplysinae]|uniref:MarR family winged helix-turn-helix transcriptional regulator n=1 Tax=Curvivirga aplysinae TaxID=2529852 RepID=UPI0012BD1658|nr:MarR family transcriptional regulator [Curvivirga aplysinae]MTI11043.1 MarR family transcriptional regulator [Curvivirga aplysinae]